jgi:signal transduction histidine kinase
MAQLLVLFGYMPVLLVAALLEERDRLAERAKAGQLRAERASEAKSRLLANVAHEIKSPVGGIIGIVPIAGGMNGIPAMGPCAIAAIAAT